MGWGVGGLSVGGLIFWGGLFKDSEIRYLLGFVFC